MAFSVEARGLVRAQIWNLVTKHGVLDIAFSPAGTDGYTDLARGSVVLDIGRGVRVPTASLADVIRSKAAAGREKDQIGLIALRRLLERISEGGGDTP